MSRANYALLSSDLSVTHGNVDLVLLLLTRKLTDRHARSRASVPIGFVY